MLCRAYSVRIELQSVAGTGERINFCTDCSMHDMGTLFAVEQNMEMPGGRHPAQNIVQNYCSFQQKSLKMAFILSRVFLHCYHFDLLNPLSINVHNYTKQNK